MNYEKKYLKYKSKYLALVNQMGGVITVHPVLPTKNSIKISGLPQGVTLKNIEQLLLSNGVHLYQAGGITQSGILVNFKDNNSANNSFNHVKTIMGKPLPTTYPIGLPYYVPPVAGAAAIAPRPGPAAGPGAGPGAGHGAAAGSIPPPFSQPWYPRTSKSLFIALPIERTSQIGIEIENRTIQVLGTSPYTTSPGSRLNDPHVSLLQIYIPDGSKLDTHLSNQAKLDNFMNEVKNIFIYSFKIDDNKPLQLHSPLGDYEFLGKWLTRVFDDSTYLNTIKANNYNVFMDSIILTLLRIIDPSLSMVNFNQKINIYSNALGKLRTPQTFTHFSINQPDSEFCISSFYTNWKPHVSLAISSNKPDIASFQQAASGKSMSFVNLWRSITPKTVITQVRPLSLQGSIKSIYGAYDNKHSYKDI